MALWLESGIYFFSAVLNRMCDEWQFLGVGILWWILVTFIITILLRNFLFDV